MDSRKFTIIILWAFAILTFCLGGNALLYYTSFVLLLMVTVLWIWVNEELEKKEK